MLRRRYAYQKPRAFPHLFRGIALSVLEDIVCDGLTPAAFREALLSRGAVLLRGAAERQTLRNISTTLDHVYDTFAALAAQSSDLPPAPDGVDAAEWEKGLWTEICEGRLIDQVFKALTARSYFDILRNSGLSDFVAHAFPDTPPAEAHHNHTISRRMPIGGRRQLWDKPLAFHVDAQFILDDRLSINFWIPLVPCGVDAPGLKVIPIGVAQTREYLEHNIGGYEPVPTDICLMHHFRCDKMELAVLDANALLQQAWAPEFAFGDVLVFTNFTMHGTHYTPAMTQPRSSLEVRVDLAGYRLDEMSWPR